MYLETYFKLSIYVEALGESQFNTVTGTKSNIPTRSHIIIPRSLCHLTFNPKS